MGLFVWVGGWFYLCVGEGGSGVGVYVWVRVCVCVCVWVCMRFSVCLFACIRGCVCVGGWCVFVHKCLYEWASACCTSVCVDVCVCRIVTVSRQELALFSTTSLLNPLVLSRH